MENSKMKIIPLVNNHTLRQGLFVIDTNSTIHYSEDFIISSQLFLQFIKDETDLCLEAKTTSQINIISNHKLPQEGYIIDIDVNHLTIEAKSDQGAFYAIQSLKQLCHSENRKLIFNCMQITDYPRFSHRSFMLDVARHFFDKQSVFKIIDYLAFYKFNYLHLHLSDDQGFRIEVDKYPLLTKIGSIRNRTITQKKTFINKQHSGFYTKSDIIEIINYAKQNFIEVIPEIDLPGHTTSILAAYPQLSCNEVATNVATTFGIKESVLCAGNRKTYQFIYDLIDELVELFPSKYFHIGGDEVKYNSWKKCNHCIKKMKDENITDFKYLQRYFQNQIANYLKTLGKTPIAWNDIINEAVNEDIIVQQWTPFKQKQTIKEINNGRKAIISNFFYLYLDYPYSMTPLEKTYHFEPILNGVKAEYNILGIEAPLWTEWINNTDRLEYQIFPRLSAVSEIAWTNKELKNYQSFCNRLQYAFKIYDKDSINYNKEALHKSFKIKRFLNTIKWFKGKKEYL